MADKNKGASGEATAKPTGSAGNGAAPTLNILAQYIKDLSFESPGAPQSLRGRDKAPSININVNVNANPIADKEFDVTLTLIKSVEIPPDTVLVSESGIFTRADILKLQDAGIHAVLVGESLMRSEDIGGKIKQMFGT